MPVRFLRFRICVVLAAMVVCRRGCVCSVRRSAPVRIATDESAVGLELAAGTSRVAVVEQQRGRSSILVARSGSAAVGIRTAFRWTSGSGSRFRSSGRVVSAAPRSRFWSPGTASRGADGAGASVLFTAGLRAAAGPGAAVDSG